MSALLEQLAARLPAIRFPARRPRDHTMPRDLPAPVATKLRALTSRTLMVAWARGTLTIIATLCVLGTVQASLDWIFDLPFRTRLLFLLADLVIISTLAYRYGVRPWIGRLTPEEAALRAERRWPDLRTALISAVQLARRPDGSPELVRAFLGRVARRCAAMDLRQAVPWRQLRNPAVMAAVLALVTTGLTIWQAPTAWILIQRLFLAGTPLPTQTIVNAISEDLSLPIGQSVELAAKATGVIPRSGRVEITYEGRPPEMVPVSAKASSTDVFTLQLANVQRPFTYRFYLNDGRGETFAVAIVHPPVVRDLAFEAVSPPYTGLAPVELAAGSLRVVAGSTLKIRGRASQPLRGARLIPSGDRDPVDMKTGGADRTEFSIDLVVPKDGPDGLSIELRNDDDILSQENTIYAIQIIPDTAPEIVMADGQTSKLSMVANQIPRLKFEVRDDFQVREVFLCVQSMNTLGEGEEPDPEKAKQIPIPIPAPAAALTFDYEWENPAASVDWAEGQTFTYWIKAVDNNDVTGPGITYSPPGEWSVVSLETKREELAEQLRSHAEAIRDLSGAQEGVRQDLGNILKQGTQP